MANTVYISAGMPPNDTGESSAANTAYVSAGLTPDDNAPAATGQPTIKRLGGVPFCKFNKGVW